MPDSSQEPVRLNDPISGDRAEQLANDLQHQKSRLVIKEVVEEYVGSSVFAERIKQIVIDHTDSVPFMNKVQKYADGQIDNRLFKNIKVVGGLLLAWIVSLVIEYAALKLTHTH